MANKEVKIAIIVGVIMITICLVAFIINKNSNKVENINLEIYKSYQLDTGTEYIRCNVTTDELIKINKEYKKAVKLKEETKLVGKQITGTYMVRDGNNFIAFDDDSKLIYVSANGIQAIFEWNSSIYEIVSGTCSI